MRSWRRPSCIRRGDADVVLAGGGEACIHPLIIAGFTTMKGLGAPRPGEGPETASRPFDATRDGFVCSEGATVLVLESVERAERRGARIHAEVVAGGNTNDAYHAVTPRPDSLGVTTMMRIALEKAGISPSAIGYLNPHGTSTPQGDAAETQAIKQVFGEHAHKLCVSSTKSATGHQFGGAGSFEVAVCALALRDQIVPPTLNYRDPDPECDLDYVPEGARRGRDRVRPLELDGPRRPQRLRRPAPLQRLTPPPGGTRQLASTTRRVLPRRLQLRCGSARRRARRTSSS